MRYRKLFSAGSAAMLTLALVACDASVNESLEVADGEFVDHGLTSVNGGIRVGREATVTGDSQSVNGGIRIDDGAEVGGLTSVNGRIRIGRDVKVDGDLQSVNGGIGTDEGTRVRGEISTVNGSIDLEGTVVEGDVETRNGEITLRGGSRVERDVIVRSVTSFGSRQRLDIELLDGSVIVGDVRVEDSDSDVTVILEAGSEVQGTIEGAEVERRPAPGGTDLEAAETDMPGQPVEAEETVDTVEAPTGG